MTTERRNITGRRTSDIQREQENAMLRTEIEMGLLDGTLKVATGAAAMFVAKLDSHVLPEATYAAADILAVSLNALSEETLRDAVELVRQQLGESLGDDDSEARS